MSPNKDKIVNKLYKGVSNSDVGGLIRSLSNIFDRVLFCKSS